MRRRAAILGLALIAAVLACNAPSAQPAETTEVSADRPAVTISSPVANAQFTVGQVVQVQSVSTDSIGVTRVDMQVNSVVVRSDTAPDPSGQTSLALLQNWTPTQPGQHTITLIAYRADGTASDPISVVVTALAATSGPVITPTSGPCTAQATTDLNVRGGPSTSYPILGVLGVGKTDPVVGRNNVSSWYQISFYAGPEGKGWVSASYISLTGNCSSVPEATYGPPPPTKVPTPTLTPVPQVTNTPQLADLVVTSIEMPTTLLLINNKANASIKVTIKNIGGVMATGFRVYLFPTGTGGSGGQIDLGVVASLHADESLTLTADYVYTVVGTYNVQVTVDPESKVIEVDEGNNIRTLAVQVSVPTPTPTPTVTPTP
jgi:uncharacterized protein YraI